MGFHVDDGIRPLLGTFVGFTSLMDPNTLSLSVEETVSSSRRRSGVLIALNSPSRVSS